MIDYKKELMDLLCIIHRDGGQYITEHGEEKAIWDARIRTCYPGESEEVFAAIVARYEEERNELKF